jgi:hypothetical protein
MNGRRLVCFHGLVLFSQQTMTSTFTRFRYFMAAIRVNTKVCDQVGPLLQLAAVETLTPRLPPGPHMQAAYSLCIASGQLISLFSAYFYHEAHPILPLYYQS